MYPYYVAKPREVSDEQSYSLLHFSCGTESFKCVELMLRLGESPNQICNLKDKSTPLHFAVLAKNFVNTKLLINYKAAVNAKDSYGNTPYHFAVNCKTNIL